MEDNINKNEIGKKKLELFLLYGQALDIHRTYYQEFGDKILNTLKEKYFLIDKNWLDNYKETNDYDSIKKFAEQYQYEDYSSFKSNIMNHLRKNNNKKALKIEAPKLEQELLADYQILIPKNFVIVKREIFEDFFLSNHLSYEIIIGEQNIFIFDKRTEISRSDNIFICSIKFNEYSDDITNFYVNVDFILILNKELASEEKTNFFEAIKNGRGVKNYFRMRNLDSEYHGAQIIVGNFNQKIGILYKISNNKNKLEEKKLFEKLCNEYVDKIYPRNVTEFILNSMNERINSVNQINIIPFRNKSKCITIYGNLYSCLRDNDFNNCSISEYVNINPHY